MKFRRRFRLSWLFMQMMMVMINMMAITKAAGKEDVNIMHHNETI